MKKVILLVAGVAGAALLSIPATAEDIKPAVIYETGGKFDKSFNEAAYKGAEKFKTETGIAYREFEVQNAAQREQAMRNFARRGLSPIIGIGFPQAKAMEKVASDFPDLQFAIVDAVVDLPNVRSIIFREQEGSYLVGMIAAMTSAGGKIGFVGGMDVPLVNKFSCGYKQGAKAVDTDIEIFVNTSGTTSAAWNDPVKGGELAKSQLSKGADVIFAAAGSTGLGVLQSVADAGKFSIGVDSNQNHIHPGSVLTSMVKRVDLAVDQVMRDAQAGRFTAGTQVLGLAEEGVGFAIDEHNAALMSEETKAKVNAAADDIIAGKIKVHDYMVDNKCPY